MSYSGKENTHLYGADDIMVFSPPNNHKKQKLPPKLSSSNSSSSSSDGISNKANNHEKLKSNINKIISSADEAMLSSKHMQLKRPVATAGATGTSSNYKQGKAKKSSHTNTKLMVDEKWIDKQEKGFTDWLNFTFAKYHGYSHTYTDDNATSSTATATATSGDTSISNLDIISVKNREAIIRQESMLLYNSSSIADVVTAVEKEVNEGRLVMRDERDIHADLGMQESFFTLLLSYELPYLRLALEIVFGKIISLPASKQGNSSSYKLQCVSSCSKWKNTIKAFVYEHMFSNADTTAKFSKHMLMYVKNEKLMKEQLRQHLLKKFMSVVLLIDAIRAQRLLSLSTVFTHASDIKSNRDMLSSFNKYFLRGEGDIHRHMALLGYTLTYTQTYIDEYDYQVTNIAIDLRDGVRLSRLVEILTHTHTLSSMLRVPAVSRLQKVHNVGLVVSKINELMPSSTTTTTAAATDICKDIVDGHREQTLLFLWTMLYGFELKLLIDKEHVMHEVSLIQANHKWRKSIYTSTEASLLAVSTTTSSSGSGSGSGSVACIHDALLRWVESIACCYGIPVYNLTSCLADGRALCLLIHYYHPTLIPTKCIHKTTCSMTTTTATTASAIDTYMEVDGSNTTAHDMRRGIEGERGNFQLIRKALREIGGVPLVVSSMDTQHVPEEKTMLLLLGYLFGRLLESSHHVRSIVRIQRFVRQCFHFNTTTITTTITTATIAEATVKCSRFSSVGNTTTGRSRRSSISSTCSSGGSSGSGSGKDVPVVIKASPKFAAVTIKRFVLTYHTRQKYLRIIRHMKQQQWEQQIERDTMIRQAILEVQQEQAQARVLAEERVRQQLVEDAMYQQLQEEQQRKLQRQQELQQQQHEQELALIADEERVRQAVIAVEMQRQLLLQQQQEYELQQEQQLQVQLEQERAREVEERIRNAHVQAIEYELQQQQQQLQQMHEEKEAMLMQHSHATHTNETHMLVLQQSLLQEKEIACKVTETVTQYELKLQQEAQARAELEHKLLLIERELYAAEQEKLQLLQRQVDEQAMIQQQKQQQEYELQQQRLLLLQQQEHARIAEEERVRQEIIAVESQRQHERHLQLLQEQQLQAQMKQEEEEAYQQQQLLLLQQEQSRIAAEAIASHRQKVLNECSSRIYKWYKQLQPLHYARKLIRGFKRLHAVYIGNKARGTSSNMTVAIIAARKRISAAEATARSNPSMQIGNLTAASLQVLQTGKMISQLLTACQTLVLSTQVSSKCCHAFASSASSTILFGLIRSCNRSGPHQELLKYSLVILLNVARYGRLASVVACASESADICIDLMQMFRDKKDIFCLACELLCRLVCSSVGVRDMCNIIEYRKRIDGLLHIMERKSRLDAKLKSIATACVTVTSSPGASVASSNRKAFPTNPLMQRNYFIVNGCNAFQHFPTDATDLFSFV